MALVCGLEASEELTVSEMGVEGPFEIPEVVMESVGECLEALWTEVDGLSAESLSSASDGAVEKFVTKTDDCSVLLGVVA